MKPKKPAPGERKIFTLRADAATWRRLTLYCRKVEDATGEAPVKNDVILEALRAWLDKRERR